MRLLRRRINTFFALQAILLFLSGARILVDPRFDRGISPLRYWLFLSGYLLLALVFLKAWRATRKPSPLQEAWARAAASISIVSGLYLLWVAHATHTFWVPGLIAVLIGVATFFLLFQSRRDFTGSKISASSQPTPANVPGD